jgi:hypothetical protein
MNDRFEGLKNKYEYAVNALPINPDITWLIREVDRLRSIVSKAMPAQTEDDGKAPHNHD